jgi:hypothetical protein
MKFFITIILTALLSFAFCLYLPWWSIAIAAFIVAILIPQPPFKAFGAASIALFLLWGGLSFWLSSNNGHLLAKKISILFIKSENITLLFLVTATIGALTAGFSALSASYLRRNQQS